MEHTTKLHACNNVGIEKELSSPSTPTMASDGLGIIEFLEDKNIFIMGATGFLGKVLVEKILRVQPKIGQLYLLIQAKDADHAKQRLHNEILCSDLFKNLRGLHGSSYEDFMGTKLSSIVGNLSKDNLGMDGTTMQKLKDKVEIIVNSAGSTSFHERYDHALNLNTKGVQRIVEFGHECAHLQLLMHISTAFANGTRKGKVMERAFKMGCSIANESEPMDMTPDIDVNRELELVCKTTNDILSEWGESNATSAGNSPQHLEKALEQAMQDLGMERAKKYGWQDTYAFTKALGEMVVDSSRGRLPVVIIRPSVVESSFKDPFPGWIEGIRMMDPLLISLGRGKFIGFPIDPQNVLDVVPVDMVVSSMLAAMTAHANKTGLEIYQVASSFENPLLLIEMASMFHEHFKEHPFADKYGKPITISKFEAYKDTKSFVEAINSIKESRSSSDPKHYEQSNEKVKKQAAYFASLYQPYTFYNARFDTTKTQQLFAKLSNQEKNIFGFNFRMIDWDTYIKKIHIPGLRTHVLKDHS